MFRRHDMIASFETWPGRQAQHGSSRHPVSRAGALQNHRLPPGDWGLAFRHSNWDGLLVLLSLALGCAMLAAPSVGLIVLAVWWGSNTVAHNFIHLPFFQSQRLNRCFSAYLSVLLGIPQRLWRDRHLAHHAERKWRLRASNQLLGESILVGVLWASLIGLAPGFYWTTYLPGWLIGLALCQLHGYYEHARGTTSHYGRVYNILFLNDGYHVEHHARPCEHWTRLRQRKEAGALASRWPACLRWLELFSLESLERIVLHSPWLQKVVLNSHERAFRQLLPLFQHARTVTIVGGGLFPRTALILQRLIPSAKITILDCDKTHLEAARGLVPGEVTFVHAFFKGDCPPGVDLLVIPLSFRGNREKLYRSNQSQPCTILIHEWLWRRRGQGAVISRTLLKRLIGLTP